MILVYGNVVQRLKLSYVRFYIAIEEVLLQRFLMNYYFIEYVNDLSVTLSLQIIDSWLMNHE